MNSTTEMPTDIPAAARALLRQVETWPFAKVTHARGQMERNPLSDTEDGNGKRKRIQVIENVDSVMVQTMHADRRAVVALWIRRDGHKSWTLDMAFRGRHSGDLAPQPLTATQLKAYVAAPDVHSALEAVAALASKAKSTATKKKATPKEAAA